MRWPGAREPGYIVKISKIHKIYFFLSIGPSLGKNRSLAPGDDYVISLSQMIYSSSFPGPI